MIPSLREFILLNYRASGAGFELFEEVVSLVVHENESGEVLYLYLPNGLHAEFGVLNTFNRLDVLLSKNSGRSADRTEIESFVLKAGVGDVDGAVPFSEHDE